MSWLGLNRQRGYHGLVSRRTRPDIGVTLIDERVDRFRCSRWLSHEL
jgi:hypothetical protein